MIDPIFFSLFFSFFASFASDTSRVRGTSCDKIAYKIKTDSKQSPTNVGEGGENDVPLSIQPGLLEDLLALVAEKQGSDTSLGRFDWVATEVEGEAGPFEANAIDLEGNWNFGSIAIV